MQRPVDPYRVLGLERGASAADVKRAYRRLAKVWHPDAAGPRGVARFLAVQAAYQAIAGELALAELSLRARRQDARAGRTDRPDREPASRWAARRDRARGRQTEAGGRRAAPDGGTGAPGDARTAGDGARRRSDPTGEEAAARRRSDPTGEEAAARRMAHLGSTSYDDATEFEPSWEGASWYGQVSGTYWTVNPREYADPRKHGPEYLARAAAEERGAAMADGDAAAGADADEDATADEDADADEGGDAATAADGAEP